MASLYKSDTGRKEILDLYDDKLAELGIEYEARTLRTTFGLTHILVSGAPSHPPLFIIHGSNACAPVSLETYPRLSSRFRVYAIDVVAQPNRSAETKMSMHDDSYGRWLTEIIALLGVTRVTLVGFSFGGLVILKTLVYDESNILASYLAAPAYIVNGNPLRALFRLFVPMKLYMVTKKVVYLKSFLRQLFTQKDPFAERFMAKVFLHFRMDFTPLPVITTAEAGNIVTPISLFGAKHDILFPGEKMIDRATKIFPSLKTAVLLEHSKHVQGKADNKRIEDLVLGAIEGSSLRKVPGREDGGRRSLAN